VQDLYATTFSLAAEDGADPVELGAARAREWLEQKVGSVVALDEPGNGEEGTDGWLVRWAHRRGEDGEGVAIDAVLEHPDARDPNQRWRTSLVLSRLHGATRVTVRLSRGATIHVLALDASRHGRRGWWATSSPLRFADTPVPSRWAPPRDHCTSAR
jgi:hypothetical protein